ncbi:MAG: hypothetical protein AB7O59_06430 [Pirellulales bacterium]
MNRSNERGAVTCARCGRALPVGAANSTAASESLTHAAVHGMPLDPSPEANSPANGYDAWELDEEVRRLQARLGTWRRADAGASALCRPRFERPRAARRAAADTRRYDGPHLGPPPRHRRKRQSRGTRRSSWLAWCMLLLGLMAFSCGTALLVYSALEARDDLWTLGLPIAIGGQVGLFLGLVLQLERVWQNGRDAVQKLDRVDEQLYRFHQASQANAPHATASESYYAHVADRASPEVLLADLQGQLDLLAAELGRK